MLILLWSLSIVTALGMTYWLAVGLRVEALRAERPTVRSGLKLDAPKTGWPSVAIIIPVHNEERVIDLCARSLRDVDYEALQLVFVLDRCTDNTLKILQRHAYEDARVKIIENDSCPDDWAGKCNAARIGAEQVKAEFLLFTDADTMFHQELVRASVALMVERDWALLSLLSTLTTDHAFERTAQPVASMSLVALYPIERVDRGVGRSRPFANGQFMLFHRKVYDAIGGHTAVKDDLLEDIAFARQVDEAGGRCGVLLADQLLRCSMYDSLRAFRLGWRRIFIEACRRKPDRLRKYAKRLLITGVLVPAVNIAGIIVGLNGLNGWIGEEQTFPATILIALAIASTICMRLVLGRIYEMGGAAAGYSWRYPIGAWIVARIMQRGANDLVHGRPVPWAGRQYVLEPR